MSSTNSCYNVHVIENKVIGLTGPIGAGKDEVAKILRRKGALIIDADKVAHTLYMTQSPVWKEIIKTFGVKVLNRGGIINRKKLAEIVFSDKALLKKLNEIVHPYLKEAIIGLCEDREQGSGGPSTSLGASRGQLIVINAAVLKEIGLIDYVDEVWVVMASKEKRMKRLVKAGFSKEKAKKRINAQASQKDYLKIADVVMRNDGTLAQLKNKLANQPSFKFV